MHFRFLLSNKAAYWYPGLFLGLLYAFQLGNAGMEVRLLSTIGDLLLLLLPVYTQLLFLIPRLFRQNRYKLYFLIAIAVVLITSYLPEWLPLFFTASDQPVYINLSNAIVLSVLSVGYDYTVNYFYQQKRKRALEKQQLETELQMLKMQLQPHFLFNTLNNLYGLALTKSDRLPGLMMQLSELLRYLHDKAGKEEVPLEKELNFLENYINLQKVRLPDHVEVRFEQNGNAEGIMITPALLINFVENGFKHLDTKMEGAFITLTLNIRDEELVFGVRNTKTAEKAENRKGMGLQNITKRLALLYPNAHELIVKDEGETFWTKLKLQLT